jgi:hypothetical protein
MSSNANVNSIIKEAVRALKAKNKTEARTLLERATELDPYSEQAWLWLSGVVDAEDDQRTCLQNVLFINPANDSAQKGISMLDGKKAQRESLKPQEVTRDDSPFAGFDLPAGDGWLDDMAAMKDTAQSSGASPFTGMFDEIDDSAFSVNLPDPFAPTQDDVVVASSGPFSSGPFESPKGNVALEEELNTLFDGNQTRPKTMGRRSKTEAVQSPEPADGSVAGLLRLIPKSVKPTRVPGTDARSPLLLRLLNTLLILGNLGALVLLGLRQFGVLG